MSSQTSTEEQREHDDAQVADAVPENGHAEQNGYRVPVRRGSEYADTLLRRLQSQLLSDSESTAVVGVASCVPRQGVTTTALNLAIRAADHRVRPALVVDANFGNPEVAKLYRKRGPGLAECLVGDASINDCVNETDIPGMSVMGIGNRKLAKQIDLHPESVGNFFKELRNDYRFVVVDLPVFRGPSTTDSIVPHVDGVLLVARYGDCKQEQLATLQRDVRGAGSDILGVVMTGERSAIPKWLSRFF